MAKIIPFPRPVAAPGVQTETLLPEEVRAFVRRQLIRQWGRVRTPAEFGRTPPPELLAPDEYWTPAAVATRITHVVAAVIRQNPAHLAAALEAVRQGAEEAERYLGGRVETQETVRLLDDVVARLNESRF